MSEYCSPSDLENRLTSNGYANVADQDDDESVEPSEVAAHITTSIEFAGGEIDAAIQGGYSTATARASGNAWLKNIAIDLATARAIECGGRGVPDYLDKARDAANKKLEAVKAGQQQIPGLLQNRTDQLTDAASATALVADLSCNSDYDSDYGSGVN